MTGPVASDVRELIREIGSSPRLAQALATAGVGMAAAAFPLQRLIGWPGLIGAMAVLIGLMAGSFIARRAETDWRGILPISLLAFLAWATISVIWSQYQWVTIGSLTYLLGFTLIALYVALVRDTIQIVRVFGDVLRVVIGVSLVIEIFSGLLIDSPIPLLAVQGQLGVGGPISGLAATRNQFGLLAIVGAVSFATEHRTRSVPRLVSILSLAGAALAILFTQSPVVLGTALLVGVAAAVLFGLRRVPADRRQVWQLITLVLASTGAAIAWVARTVIVDTFSATGVLTYRLELWNKIFDLVRLNFLQGWGWVGRWRTEIVPFSALTTSADRPAQSALNSYLDVWFQLGLIGVAIFVGMLGLAFVRSWLLAGRRRSVVYAWHALVLVALIVMSLAESSLLTEFGWLTFVICCLKASQELSWRRAFTATESAPPA
ncbi:MAG: O-antigen ligase family protein [Pseudolysinimonas sp.]